MSPTTLLLRLYSAATPSTADANTQATPSHLLPSGRTRRQALVPLAFTSATTPWHVLPHFIYLLTHPLDLSSFETDPKCLLCPRALIRIFVRKHFFPSKFMIHVPDAELDSGIQTQGILISALKDFVFVFTLFLHLNRLLCFFIFFFFTPKAEYRV